MQLFSMIMQINRTQLSE